MENHDDIYEEFQNEQPYSSEEPADDRMDDREILHRIWAKITQETDELKIERYPDYAILMERYPDQERWVVLYAASRIEEQDLSDLKAQSELLRRIEKMNTFHETSLRMYARSLAYLMLFQLRKDALPTAQVKAYVTNNFGEEEDSEDGIRQSLFEFEKHALNEGHEQTAGGKSLGIPAAAAPTFAEFSYEELATALKEAPVVSYRIDCKVNVGYGVQHPKFGLGFVARKEAKKALVKFPDAARTLIVGQHIGDK